jgi:glycosyltransferase involved in cell wall biosynthesis
MNNNKILISVIIPVYQDKKGLADTVNSILAQDFPRERYEIIIADNNSRDGTKQAALEFQQAYPDQIKVVHQDQIQSSYATRNAGIKAANGEICCFIDADMIAHPDYLSRVYIYFNKDENLMYFGCNVLITKTAATLSDKMNRKYDFNMKQYFEKSHYSGTGCLSVRRCIFDKVGLFDDRLESSGDKEFGQRVHAAGLKQYYDHDLVLYHPSRSTYGSIIKKYKRIARGHAQLVHYYPERYGYYKADRYYNVFRYIPPVVSKLLALPFILIISTGKFFYDLPIRLFALKAFHSELRRLSNQKEEEHTE